MLVAGDEISRTQKGNNNAYCQDNEISWVDWKNADEDLLNFTRRLINLRTNHPSFCRKRWFQGKPIKGIGIGDIAWFLPDGIEMTEEHWNNDFAKSLGIYLNGRGLHSLGPKEEPIVDDSFYVIFNAHHDPLTFSLPEEKYGNEWKKVLDTGEGVVGDGKSFGPKETLTVEGRSVILLQNPKT
jgi:glycogen operon protein